MSTAGAPAANSTVKPGAQPEPWLRGTLSEVPACQRAVLHALELAREDIGRWCTPLTDEEFHARPHGLAPVGFHLLHIVGSLDRLLTYAESGAESGAEGAQLNDAQKQYLARELKAPATKAAIFEQFEKGISAAGERIRGVDPSRLEEARRVGRKELPTTVGGLLVHCADHTQRHVGQAVTTAKVLVALRGI